MISPIREEYVKDRRVGCGLEPRCSNQDVLNYKTRKLHSKRIINWVHVFSPQKTFRGREYPGLINVSSLMTLQGLKFFLPSSMGFFSSILRLHGCTGAATTPSVISHPSVFRREDRVPSFLPLFQSKVYFFRHHRIGLFLCLNDKNSVTRPFQNQLIAK